MKLKVLHITTKSGIVVAQKYVSVLSANLDKEKFEIKVFSGGNRSDSKKNKIRWLSNGIFPWLFFLNDLLAIFELIKIFRRERPDVIHLNSSKAGVLGAIAAKLYCATCRMSHAACPKVIFTAHGWVFNPDNDIIAPIRWFYVLLHKFAALFQDKIICVSQYDYNLAIKYKIAPTEKIISIHNGINPDINFLDKETARQAIIKKFPSSDIQLPIPGAQLLNSRWIGSIGRLSKEKKYEDLIKAASLTPNAYFFLIGDGPQKNKLQKTIKKINLQNRFFILNPYSIPTDNLPSFIDSMNLKAFDIFAMSSIKEGLPYSLLEAMAAGLPAVVTEAGGMPEVIKNGENGFLVAKKRPDLLATAIKNLLDKPKLADQFKTTARQTIKEKFNLEKMVRETEMTYEELLKRNPIEKI